MLFSSPEFIFVFLPLVFAGFLLTRRFGLPAAGMLWLIASSLFFYGWWNPRYLALIVPLIIANYVLARLILGAQSALARRAVLVAGLTLNLGTLGYYKYTNFMLQSSNALLGSHFHIVNIVLPLGISFFTFQKIAFLVDTYRGHVKRIGLAEYSLFVLFFPQLIAGPIVHHAEVVPQFRNMAERRIRWDNLGLGLSVFFIGLFKKVVLADTLAAYAANPVFAAVAHGASPRFVEAWGGVLGYTLQLYFDFSGYSDMAIGAALLFGIRLPQNFDSPYKSASIIEFWRRWHMTLSRFLRDYLYFPLGGNRQGSTRRYLNLFITMLLGGLWHGAGWTFVIWGALHGAYLGVNHGWRALRERWNKARGSDEEVRSTLAHAGSVALTFLAVVVGWVFFRADSMGSAKRLLGSMFGANGMVLPASLDFASWPHRALGQWVQFLPGSSAYGSIRGGWPLMLIAALLAWCWLLPNPQQIFSRFETALSGEKREPRSWLQFKYDWRSAVGIAAAILISLLFVQSNIAQEFLYFDF